MNRPIVAAALLVALAAPHAVADTFDQGVDARAALQEAKGAALSSRANAVAVAQTVPAQGPTVPELEGRFVSDVEGAPLSSLDLSRFEIDFSFSEGQFTGNALGFAKARVGADGRFRLPATALSGDITSVTNARVTMRDRISGKETFLLSADLDTGDLGALGGRIGAIHYTELRKPLKVTLRWGDMSLDRYVHSILDAVDPWYYGWIKGFDMTSWELVDTAGMTSGFSAISFGGQMPASGGLITDETDLNDSSLKGCRHCIADVSMADARGIERSLPAVYGFVAEQYYRLGRFQMFNRTGWVYGGIKVCVNGTEGGGSALHTICTSVVPLASYDDRLLITEPERTFEFPDGPHAQRWFW